MGFDIQETKRSLSGRSTSVIGNLDVRTGAEQVAQAVGGAGAELGRLAIISNDLEAKVQIAEFDRQALEAKNNLEVALAGQATTDNYDQLFSESVSGLEGLAPRNKKAANHAQDVIATLRINGEKMMTLEKIKRNKQTALLDMFNKVESGNFDGAREDIDLGVKSGLITAAQGISFLSDIKIEETQAGERDRFLLMLNQAKAIAGTDQNAALDFIDSQAGKLSANHTKDRSLREDAISQIKGEKARSEEARKDQARVTTNDYFEAVWDGNEVDVLQLNKDVDAGLVTQADKKNILNAPATLLKPSDPTALVEMDELLLQLGDNRVDRATVTERLQQLSPDLHRDDITEYRRNIPEQFDISQDAALSRAEVFAKSQIISPRTETLLEQILGLINQETDPAKKKELKLDLKSKKEQFRAEHLRLHRYNLAMGQWLKQNPKAAPEVILKEGMRKAHSEFGPLNLGPELAAKPQPTVKDGFVRVGVVNADGIPGTISVPAELSGNALRAFVKERGFTIGPK